MSKPKARAPVRYAEVIQQIGQGNLWSAYVDDTGPAGKSASPHTLPADRQTHVAAIFTPEGGKKLVQEMPGMLSELQSWVGVNEFHFVHIYNGKGPFRDIAISTRLELFDAFVHAIEDADVRFLVQSLDTASSANVFDAYDRTFSVGSSPFDGRDRKQLSLFFLLLKLRRHLEEQGAQAAVFLDEGWKKNGIALQLPEPWQQAFLRGLLMCCSSTDIWGLQFADFAGFVLNRSQMLLGKTELSELDLSILSFAERIAPRFLNLKVRNATVTQPEGAGYRIAVESDSDEL